MYCVDQLNPPPEAVGREQPLAPVFVAATERLSGAFGGCINPDRSTSGRARGSSDRLTARDLDTLGVDPAVVGAEQAGDHRADVIGHADAP